MLTCRSRLTWILVALCVTLSVVLVKSTSVGDSIALEQRRVHGAWLYVITADLNDPRIRIDIGLPAKGLSHSESFVRMIRRRGPLAAVTGTYFDPRSLLPVGTIVVGGKVVHVNHIGTTVGFTGSTRVTFVATAKGESCSLAGVDCGLRTGPRLLAGGSYALNPRREGFRYSGLFGRHRRVALGVTQRNKLLLVAVSTPVTFGKLAGIMKSLGATDAVCLDGGSSSAMYYRGRLVCRPGRALTNILEVHWSPTYVTVVQAPRPVAANQAIAAAENYGSSAVQPTAPEQVAAFPEPCLSHPSKQRQVQRPARGSKSPGPADYRLARALAVTAHS